MKQTAVEWLLENLISEPYSEKDFEHNKNCWDKAELMFEEQIIDAYQSDRFPCSEQDAENYYNETYGGDKQ
jgi:hypothetical protein